MRIVALLAVLSYILMTVDSKIIRHLTTYKKVQRTKTTTVPPTTTTQSTRMTLKTLKRGGNLLSSFEFPFPTTEKIEKIYDESFDDDIIPPSNTAELSAMFDPPDNISDYHNIYIPSGPPHWKPFTLWNHKERNFKQTVLNDLAESDLKPVHLNMSEDMVYWRRINKVPDKYWPDKEHVYILHIVSEKFKYRTHEQRHAMVHEALKEEMTKREAGCAIDIHADTPEEWNQFKANNDFDENKGQVDLRVRSKKRSTVISPQDAELRVKIYKYLKMHFDPLHLHVVDSKDQHPVDNDNPAFDVLIVSNKFNNLTITQRTVLVHDYLRDYINEGIQFRLHSLQSPEEVYPDRFNIDGFETAAFVQVLDIHKYINPYRIYEPPPKHVVHLNNLLINNQSVIADAKKKLREWDQKRLKEKEAG